MRKLTLFLLTGLFLAAFAAAAFSQDTPARPGSRDWDVEGSRPALDQLRMLAAGMQGAARASSDVSAYAAPAYLYDESPRYSMPPAAAPPPVAVPDAGEGEEVGEEAPEGTPEAPAPGAGDEAPAEEGEAEPGWTPAQGALLAGAAACFALAMVAIACPPVAAAALAVGLVLLFLGFLLA